MIVDEWGGFVMVSNKVGVSMYQPANKLMKTRKLLTNFAVFDRDSLVNKRIMTLLAFAGVS